MEKVIRGYLVRVWVIMIICMADIFVNGYADNTSFKPEESFIPYLFVGAQIAFQVVNILLVFMLFSGTYLFQVGLLDLQMREFKFHLLGIFAYMGLFLAYGSSKLVSAAWRVCSGRVDVGGWVGTHGHRQEGYAFLFFFFFPPLPPLPSLTPFLPTLPPLSLSPHPTHLPSVLPPFVWRGKDLGAPRVCDHFHPSKAGLHAVLHAHAHHLRPHGGHHLVSQGTLGSQV